MVVVELVALQALGLMDIVLREVEVEVVAPKVHLVAQSMGDMVVVPFSLLEVVAVVEWVLALEEVVEPGEVIRQQQLSQGVLVQPQRRQQPRVVQMEQLGHPQDLVLVEGVAVVLGITLVGLMVGQEECREVVEEVLAVAMVEVN